ncbi:MAG TPA: substrate-binding domain-containing protein [Spirochaetia bacterium]|nr:substrate-binding domain-containing protein [Spirochaetia bacterium]
MAKRVITQKDIATALGVSRGTIDRALHDRPGINSEIKHKVLQYTKERGYSPNKLAQFLVTGKQLTFAMITPGDPLWAKVREGADSFLSELGSTLVNVKWFQTEVHDPEREVTLFRSALVEGVDGIGIVPSDPALLTPLIDESVDQGIPVVTVNTDAPSSKRLLFIGQNPELAGEVGADLLGNFLNGSGKVAVVTAFRNVLVHKIRCEAFCGFIARHFPQIEIVAILESRDSAAITKQVMSRVLADHNDLSGVYLTTGTGIAGVGEALVEAGAGGRVRVVCYDFFRETANLLKEGIVTATIGEDPYGQGYQSVKALYDRVVDGVEPGNRMHFTRMDIGVRANIDLLVN